MYLHACVTGVGAAMDVLPRTPKDDEFRARGQATCEGSLRRLRATGQLEREKDLSDLACGYAIGAMFVHHGLAGEVQPTASERVLKAADACTKTLAKQGAQSKKMLEAKAPTGTCYTVAEDDGMGNVIVRVSKHIEGATFVRAWRNRSWSEEFGLPVSQLGKAVACPGKR